MSLGLIKPGASVALRHPKTGMIIKPIGYLKSGKAVWPVLGASPEDEDDPKFTGEEDDDSDEDEDEDDDDEEDPKSKKRPAKKSSKKDEDDEEEDDEDDDRLKASRQAKRYRLALRDEQKKNAEMATRLKALEDKDKDPDEVQTREVSELNGKLESLTEVNRIMTAQLAFFKTPAGVEWVDASDAFALAEREGLFDDVIDEDGTVDTRELRRGLRDLAKRKKHLVKVPQEDPKARGRKSTEEDDEDEDEDEEESSSRRSTTMNNRRKGSKAKGSSRAELAKKFPVLNNR